MKGACSLIVGGVLAISLFAAELLAIGNCRLKVRQGRNLVFDADLKSEGMEVSFDEKAFACVAKPTEHHNQEIVCTDSRSKVVYGTVLMRENQRSKALPVILSLQTKEKTFYLQAWCN